MYRLDRGTFLDLLKNKQFALIVLIILLERVQVKTFHVTYFH